MDVLQPSTETENSMIVTHKKKGFISVTAHPTGCRKNVQNQIEYISEKPKFEGAKKVLVVGCSTGYGLASRIVHTYGTGAMTLGVSFEKEPTEKKTATAGWYNNQAFQKEATNAGYYAKTINADAFSTKTKQEICQIIKEDLGQIDMLVYSLASPKRSTDEGESYKSSIKPIGASFSNNSLVFDTNEIVPATIEPANEEEIAETIKVMGGEDWMQWVTLLKEEGLLAQNFTTLAYSYLGPVITHPIYLNGTIGQAKKHLKETSDHLNSYLSDIQGKSYVSINKALVTQASSAIPIVPLYISILYKVMKEKGTHENCIEQMYRLFQSMSDNSVLIDEDGYLRVDDWEMDPEVQATVHDCLLRVNNENITDLADLLGLQKDFDNLFGFCVDGVDYSLDVNILDV